MNYWTNLGLTTATNVAATALNKGIYALTHGKQHIQYRSKAAYKSKYAAMALMEANRKAREAISALANKKIVTAQQAVLKQRIEALKERNQRIIENAVSSVPDYGRVPIKEGAKEYYYAKDKMGRIVEESLMLYYDSDTTIKTYLSTQASAVEQPMYETNRVIFADITPQVSLSSNKNIVMTQVQGRDYTRKELVSGGDLSFKVTGSIVSPLTVGGYQITEDGTNDFVVQYPEEEIKKFIQIMQYPGIINVNHYLFRQFNVNRIIIQDYSLDQATYQNIQPYSFTCVAVEPDEDVIATEDTIYQIDEALSAAQTEEEKVWLKALKEQAGGLTTTALESGATIAMNKLSKWI